MEIKQNLSNEPAMIPLGERGQIKVSNVIHGFLPFDKKSNVKISNVQIFLVGIDQALSTIEPTVDVDGARFEFSIDSIARAGVYNVVWNVFISGKESKVINSFTINSDSIDRTLPLELQHLA